MSGSISNSSIRTGREADNPYYPPRARGGVAVRELWWRLVRRWQWPGAQKLIPAGVSPERFLAALAVPGFAFVAARHVRLGVVVMALAFVCAVVFVVFLGWPICWGAASLLMAVHMIGLAFLLEKAGAARRVKAVLVAVVLVGGCVYGPLFWGISRVFLPLQVDGRVAILKRQAPRELARGGWVGIRVPGGYADSIRLKGGIWLVRVLGVPGDVVEFSKDSYRVNGESFGALDYMPTKGRVVLGQDEWFVWSSLNIRNHGVDRERVSGFLMGYSVIPRSRVLGVPCKTWFGRKIELP